MKFRTWLKKQIKRDDPIGDVARDAFRDKKILDFETLQEWLSYLRYKACSEAINAVIIAWKEYDRDQEIAKLKRENKV